MKLVIFTIVLDGMPFIKWQYECFKNLKCDWTWIVIEGSASNGGSTCWCRPQEARFSNDGTFAFLDEIKDERVLVLHGAWSSKDKMVNDACKIASEEINEPCVLMQIDVDEIHKPESIEKVVELFTHNTQLGMIRFPCRYFVGPKIVCAGQNCWSNWDKEYDRAWRFERGMKFVSHEPPKLDRMAAPEVLHRPEDLRFDHLAYVTESQVAYKEKFYGYEGLLNQWRALQRNTYWPARLSRFFTHVSGYLPTVRQIN